MKIKRKTKIVISLILVIILAAGGYVANMFGGFNKGNYGKYSLGQTQALQSSPLNGKTIIFLGSSVTYGYGSFGVSFVDFLAAEDGINTVKEAVSGTTLVDVNKSSYVSRMKTIDKGIKADAFVCQLSTNDATKKMPLGQISDSADIDTLDTKTIAGAIEYIILYAKATWNCPVVFYTQARYDSQYYGKMVELLEEIQNKYDITVIDLWNDDRINDISDDEKRLYMTDHIHPTKAGYKEWWLPTFRKALYEVIEDKQ